MVPITHDNHLSAKKSDDALLPCAMSRCIPRLWRSLQTIIQGDARAELSCQLSKYPEQYVHLLLTHRLANDPGQYSPSQKSRIVQFPGSFRREAWRKFGVLATDLDALQMALMLRREHLAIQLVEFLGQYAPSEACTALLNHPWGQGNTTLHLACFLNSPRLVQLLLDMGADQTSNAKHIRPSDCCTSAACLMLLNVKHPTVVQDAPSGQRTANLLEVTPHWPRQSVLLKKATERPHPPLVDPLHQVTRRLSLAPAFPIPEAYFKKPTRDAVVVCLGPHSIPGAEDLGDDSFKLQSINHSLSSLSFSSSSSSSSLSSLSSTDDVLPRGADAKCWTPPLSPPTLPPQPLVLMTPCQSPVNATLSETQSSNQNEVRTPDHPDCVLSERSPLHKVRRQVRFDPCVVLTEACTRGDLPELTHQMEQYALNSTMFRGGIGGAKNRSLLQIAVIHNHETLAAYLSTRVDVNHRDIHGWSALHYAAALRRWKLLEYLVSLEQVNLSGQSRQALETIYACVDADADKRRCKLIIERAIRRANLK